MLSNDPEMECKVNGTRFFGGGGGGGGIDVFILINLAGLILRYCRQNITIRVFICYASNNIRPAKLIRMTTSIPQKNERHSS